MEKTLQTEQVSAGKRTYFFDIKQTVKGDNYLAITESKKKDDGSFERHSIIVFSDDIENFSEAYTRSILKYTKK